MSVVDSLIRSLIVFGASIALIGIAQLINSYSLSHLSRIADVLEVVSTILFAVSLAVTIFAGLAILLLIFLWIVFGGNV